MTKEERREREHLRGSKEKECTTGWQAYLPALMKGYLSMDDKSKVEFLDFASKVLDEVEEHENAKGS